MDSLNPTGALFASPDEDEHNLPSYVVAFDRSDSDAPLAFDLAEALGDEPVASPVFSPAFDITFNFTDGNTSYAATAAAAAAFWELAITADLPDTNGTDDLRVDSRIGLIGFTNGTDGPGNVLANAGPTQFRSTSSLPYVGQMGIDPADAGNVGLQSIIVHEIGHVLGAAGFVRSADFVRQIDGQTRYIGSSALAEYRILSNNAAASSILLQSGGAHWDEATFGRELMTPLIDTSQLAPLSRMTLASLRDIGYTVDLGYSDPFSLASTPTALRDDLSGNFNTTTSIAMNASLSRTIEQSEDNDWFRVSLTSGVSYTFDMNGADSGAGTLADPFLALRTLDGGIVASDNDTGTGRNASIVYTPTATGTYFLDASGVGITTGTYTLSASTAQIISPGSITISDVTIAEGNSGTQTAMFTVTRSGGTSAFGVSYSTANGTATSGTDYLATAGTLSFATGVLTQTISVSIVGDRLVEPNETFFVNLFNATNNATILDSQGIGTIRDDDVPDDFADNRTDTTHPFGTLNAIGIATGQIEAIGDRDWFRIELTAGSRYALNLSGYDTSAGSLRDPLLRLYDASGSLLTQNDDDGPGFDARVLYTAPTSGTYFVEAGAYFDNGVGTYRLNVSGNILPDPDGSPLVDDRFYYARNPDVANAGMDPEQHYADFGWREGRDPNAFFSTSGYLAANADVRNAGMDPLAHYDGFGWREGRDPSARFDNELYLARNPDVANAGIDPLAHFLVNGQAEGRQAYTAIGRSVDIANANGFDAEYYLLNNLDVARAANGSGVGDTYGFAIQHYRTFGWHEGRNPNAAFDVNGYLSAYGDIRAANIDPLAHYDQFGWREGRDPSANFDTSDYLAAYRDIAAAGIDPMTHYLAFGLLEGRLAFADGRIG